MAENITKQQIKDINSAAAYLIICDESKNNSDIEQIVLFCQYVNSAEPQEELVELIQVKGRKWEDDICEAVLDCLRAKEIKTTHLVSVATDWAPNMTGVQRGFVALLQSLDRNSSVHPAPRGIVRSNVSSRMLRGHECCHSDCQ